MPKFLTIGYGDRAGYDRTPSALREAAHAHDAALRNREGTVMGTAGAPVTVRNPDDDGVNVNRAPYMSSMLPVAGFALVDASSIDEAIALVAKTPCAVAHGVVEIWPLE